MAGEFIDVRDDHGLPLRVSVTANALVKVDPRTRQWALERPEHKLVSLFQIEPNPKEIERFFQYGSRIGKVCDQVGFAGYEGLDLRNDLGIDCRPVSSFREQKRFCHNLSLSLRQFEGKTVDSITKILFVAGGGAVGAVARYLVNISPLARVFEHFPLATFVINVTGSFLIGFLLILLTDRIEINDNLRMMVIVGFLGAFTTFSTFEMEIYGLLKDKFYAVGIAYMLLSVTAGFLGVLLGIAAARRLP